MKLKPDWLDQLSSAARKRPDDVPEHLPRTEARVLSALRDASPSVLPWKAMLAGLGVCSLVIAVITLWPYDGALPEVSAEALADLEAAEWQAPSDALLADASPRANGDLMREINQLLNQP
jgi:hypothetical protein